MFGFFVAGVGQGQNGKTSLMITIPACINLLGVL